MPRKSTKRKQVLLPYLRAAILGVVFLILLGVSVELFNLAWGSGRLLGRLSLKWVVALAPFLGIAIGLTFLAYVALNQSSRLKKLRSSLLAFRQRLATWRWPLIAILALFPVYFVFFSPWGGLFIGIFTRITLFAASLLAVAFLLGQQKNQLIEIRALLISGLALGTLLTLAESLALVTGYPFALHWSEGNRLWDYSVLFARDRYNYPGSEPIFAWIDSGRQALWGLPYLIASVPIWAVRLWSALLVTVPYALLGWIAFRPVSDSHGKWLAAGFWALIFLNQGPIYTPLVLCAILVAAARRTPILLAIPLVFLAGHYAGVSRYSWRFAPGIWAVILALGDGVILHGRLLRSDWLRAGVLGLAGIWSKGLPILFGIVQGLLPVSPSVTPTPDISGQPGSGGVETLQGLQATATHHPFLWYRLFPNEVYSIGILLGLILATGALIWLFIYLVRKGYWKTVAWQRVITSLGLLAFLVIGVIASAKIGGGADLHNLDMFLVALVLVAGIAWESGLHKNLAKLLNNSSTVRFLLSAMVLIPALMPMINGRPQVLADRERTEFVLQRIQSFVACARQHGEVLFMDQRQLITFGYMEDLPLVVDYEKKFVMDQALAGNEEYFEQFHADLGSGRFSLIVTEREAIMYKAPDQESIGDGFLEENNAWVEWVTVPLLQNYESVGEYKDAAVELFMPTERDFACP
jgi:hypothetical protein